MLRTTIIIATLLASATAAQSQEYAVSAGSIQLAGSAAFTSQGRQNVDGADRATSLRLSPSVHYFVADRLSIGADATIGYASVGDLSSRTLGIGPAVTYYFGTTAATVHPYLAARAAAASTRYDTSNDSEQFTVTSGTAAAGVLAMLSRAVGVTSELFYQVQNGENDIEDSNTFGLAVGVAAFVF